jgi:sugar phosphate isomerase/epimerase
MTDSRRRFSFSGPGSWSLEQTLEWAAANAFGRIEFNADTPANYPASFDSSRVQTLRARAEGAGIRMAIHTLSAVNMAEITPVMAAAADEYVRQNMGLAGALGCDYIVVHGGFHFTSDVDRRMDAAIARISRAADQGSRVGLDVVLENHNLEPEHAEVRYMPHNVAEMRRYLDGLSASNIKWSANVGHAELVPEGFDGFLEAFGGARIAQVRLHDTHKRYEEHLIPGKGLVDFPDVFRKLTAIGFDGPFSLDFGRPDDKLEWRDKFAAMLDEV